MWKIVVSLLLINVASATTDPPEYFQPEQIHLSYGGSPSEMMVTWVTMDKPESSQVEYGLNRSLTQTAKGTGPTIFTDGGEEHRSMWIHRVRLTALTPGDSYLYRVGGPDGWSDLLFFTAMRSGSDWSPRIAIYGDMGNTFAASLASLQKEAQSGGIDSILHIGDFAYDMDVDNARVGDAFMNEIQPIAAYVPYMTCPGNHEQKYNFSNYKNRFTMPGENNLFYSYNVGPAHIVSISTEFYYYDTYNITGGVQLVAEQYKWLQQDLALANSAASRAARPWLIVVGHRPMYCSSNDGPTEHCNNLHNNLVRTGLARTHLYNLEDLFYKAGVDLQFYAHEHSYERLWPVYNLTVCNGTSSPYVDPRAPVHIITGSAGNKEGQTGFDAKLHPWSAAHTDDFGFTRLHVLNATHVSLQQVSINQGGKVFDEMTLVKHKHGPGLYDCHPLH